VNDYLASIADHRTMARNDAIALRQLSQWATKARIFVADPLASISLPKGRGGKRKPFADADVPAIIAAAGESNFGPHDRAVVIVSLAAALRLAEVWHLRLEDIDLPGGWVSIRRETTKSNSGERTIPLDPQAVAALDEDVRDCRPRGDGPLFLNAHGDPFTYWGFMALFSRLHNRLRKQGSRSRRTLAAHGHHTGRAPGCPHPCGRSPDTDQS
jgi:integrase